MTCDLYSFCFLVDDEEEEEEEASVGIVSSVGPSLDVLSIPGGWFSLHTCPPRMGGHGAVVAGSSSFLTFLDDGFH